ncbi:phage tail tape measure protein [Staphylococcus pseudintermedius]|uniref:phage tail tape measure protein n=1 Tax=Staphylococcus pseudintermedius TaxID=283734 RepID=UPI00165524E3|nr:phage tail tape measure protein [Staphylococcus pseudintermedius]MBC8710363.1 phage tail tape measure protein [Staphylococcus pseudintermedius]
MEIKGLSVLMDAKDVGVQRTLQQIKGQFRTLSNEMSRSSNNFKHSEKSMQSLKQRSKELSKGISVAENSMKDIANQLKKMSTEEQRTSVYAERLRAEYSRQHKALNMYQRQLAQTDKELARFNGATKRTVFSMEKVNSILTTMRRQLNIANMSFEKSGKSVKGYQSYLNQLNAVIQKHQNTIKVLESRYKKVSREQGVMSKEALELKEKILQEKQSLSQLDAQYKQTTAEAKRFAMEQKTMTMSMSQIRERITSVTNALKISSANFKMSGQTASAYKAHIAELNNGMKQQELIVQNLSGQYDYAKRQYGATSKEAQELNLKLTEERVKLKDLSGELKQATNAHNRLEMEQRQGIASMSEIRAKMQSFNDVLSLSRSNFSRAGESVKSYRTHLDTLKSSLSSQRTVLRELNAQYKFVAAAQGKNSEEARELSSAITQQKIKMNELEAEIKETSTAYKQLTVAQQNAQRLSATGFGRSIQAVDKYKDSIRNVAGQMRAVGTGSLIYMTMPAVAAMGGAIKTSIDWEQALAGVAKTTNMSGSELKKMGDEITSMSNKMPFAATEIAGVAESAGQLGVKKKDITAFTKTMLNMGVATNLTADEAATEFARFANAAKMPIAHVDRLGSTVTALGNTTATTEAEIVELGQRLAGAGAQAGFSADEIMSISAAMSSAGINAEAGGTAMTQIFNKMTRAVASGGKDLENFAQTSGMSAEEFANTWQNNPSKALSMFVKGLSETKGGAKGVLKALDDVGIKGVREADTIRRMANNHKLLEGALKTGSEAWKKNTALTDEASIRYETMGSKLKVLKNTFFNFLRTIGDAIAPIVIKMSDALTGLFKHLQGTSNATKIVITVFALLAASIPPLLIGVGLLASGITNIASAVKLLNGTKGGAAFFNLFNGGINSALPKIGQMITKIPILGSMFTLLTGPVGIAVAAIAAVGTAFIIAYKKSETFRNIVNSVITPVKNAFQDLGNYLKSFWKGITQIFNGNTKSGSNILEKLLPKQAAKDFTETLVSIREAFRATMQFLKSTTEIVGAALRFFWKQHGNEIVSVFNFVKTNVGIALKVLYGAIIKPILAGIKTTFSIVFLGLKFIVINTFSAIKNIVQGALNVLSGLVKIFKGVFTGDFRLIWSGIKQIFQGALTFILGLVKATFGNMLIVVSTIMVSISNVIKSIFTAAVNVVKLLLRGLGVFIKSVFNAMANNIKFYMNIVKNVIVAAWNYAKSRTLLIVRTMVAAVKAIFNTFASTTRSIFNSLRSFFSSIFNSIKNNVIRLVRSMWSGVKGIFSTLSTWTRKTFNNLRSYLINLWSNLRNRVVSIVRDLWRRVKGTFTNLYNGTRSIFNRVKSTMTNIWSSIKRSVTGIASSLWASVKRTFNNMANGLKSIIGRIKSHIGGMVSAIKRGLNGLIKGLNWVGSKLSLPKIPTLSTGTQRINRHIKTTHDGRLKHGTMAVVGDKGPGNGRGIDGRRELIQYPNGRTALTPAKDTTTWLPKGSRVISGSMRQQYEEAEGAGMYPRFSVGTWLGKSTNWLADKAGAIGSAIKNSAGWLTDKIGDVMDFMDNPGKLFNKVMSLMGVDFGGLTKGMGIVGQIARAAFAKIKKGAIDWIKGGFDAQAGDGSVFDGFRILQPYSAPPKAPNPNYPFNGGVHHGVDYDTPVGTPIRTPMGGRVRSWYDNYGGGKAITVQKGRTFLWFMHLSEQLRRTGEQIKAGQLIGKSGNTGSMTNYRHLHFQVNQGGEANRFSTDPIPWLRKNDKTGGGKGYPAGSGAAYASRVISQAQSILGGRYKSRYIHDQMMRVAKRESNYQPNVVNNWDINALRGDPSRGLFQIIGSTFRANAKSGYTNFNNPVHQAISAMRYIVARYGWGGFPRAAAYAYKTGGLIKNEGWYNLAEGGHPEWIIPTDPAMASEAMKLLALAAQDIDRRKTTGNKRPKQLSGGSFTTNDDTALLLKMIENQQTQINQQQEQMQVLMQIAAKELVVDESSMERVHNKFQDKRERQINRAKKFKGGAAFT